jgi:hypothetical protein
MQRWLSIFLVLVFGLGPLAAALPANDDARLPACCRRHGAHHCAMAMQMAALISQAAKGESAFTAPVTCPYFPGRPATPASMTSALAATSVGLPELLAQAHSSAAARAAARLSQVRTRVGRGPPASNLA